jgi:hypothetical protein
VQMPLQRVVEPDALTDEPLAVIDQQPQIELWPVPPQVRGREGLKALLQRNPGDSERVDRIGLAADASCDRLSRSGGSGGLRIRFNWRGAGLVVGRGWRIRVRVARGLVRR